MLELQTNQGKVMRRTCAKCGHVNDDASATADAACPRCDANYAKAALAAAKEKIAARELAEKPEPEHRRRWPEVIVWFAVLVAAIFAIVPLTRMTDDALSAIQVAALAGKSLALAAVPYVMARAIEKIRQHW